ncbi:hypothetical protein KC345_g265 [Hortaea werneckii]|nr:hypothetical protein KC345_g265 [Hortaea werneckii]
MATSDFIDTSQFGAFIFFGVVTTIGVIWVFFFVPETKGRTLEEMDEIFGDAGLAHADNERKEKIERDIGLTALLGGDEHAASLPDEKNTSGSDSEQGHGEFVDSQNCALFTLAVSSGAVSLFCLPQEHHLSKRLELSVHAPNVSSTKLQSSCERVVANLVPNHGLISMHKSYRQVTGSCRIYKGQDPRRQVKHRHPYLQQLHHRRRPRLWTNRSASLFHLLAIASTWPSGEKTRCEVGVVRCSSILVGFGFGGTGCCCCCGARC